jgi:CubicO group peptidase (beta-lactamase class C family)
MPSIDEARLTATITDHLHRWPSVGVAVGIVRDGSLAWFRGYGLADIASTRPVTADTVFRIGSITKTLIGVAVLQLLEQGLVDLDAPAGDYLRAFELVLGRRVTHPPTVHHLLTHTAGIGYWRRLSDLRRPGWGSGVSGPTIAVPADYYRRGLLVEVEPGTKWVYSDHGIATLGQIVEDVTGEPIGRYLRDHVLAPLGMGHSDIDRSEPLLPLLATGYTMGRHGARPVVHREVPLTAAGGAYASTADLARYVAALLDGGSNEHGTVLKPETVAVMFAPHFQPDPRIGGMGLTFERGNEDGHTTVGHSGVVAGFLSMITLAPDDGVGVVVLTNTGRLDGRGIAEALAGALMRVLLDLPDQALRTDLAPHPEIWHELCGWYGPDPGPVTNLFTRALVGAGAQVRVRDGHLELRTLTPVAGLRQGLRLYPDDPHDPRSFRADFSWFGKGAYRIVFAGDPGTPATKLLLEGMAFPRRRGGDPRPLQVGGAVAIGALAVAGRRKTRRSQVKSCLCG